MESLIATYPSDFFPRHELTLEGRQRSFRGVGRFDLLFRDHFGFSVLMELKAVPARYEDASQLARYRDAMLALGDARILMWLVAPSIPASVCEFLDHVGIEHTEIHVAEFKRVATNRDYQFAQRAELSSLDLFNANDGGSDLAGEAKSRPREPTRIITPRRTTAVESYGEEIRKSAAKGGSTRGTAENREQLQCAKLLDILRDYIHRPFDATMEKYRVSKRMHVDKVIQWSYISRRVLGLPAFRNDRVGPTFALKHTVDLFIADKTISELSARQLLSRYQYIGKAYSMSNLERDKPIS